MDGLDNNNTDRGEEYLKRLELAVQGSTDGLWDWNIETGEVFYFPRFRELLGYDSEAGFPNLFESFESHLHPEDHAATFAAIDDHLKNGTPYDMTYRLRCRKGDYRWFRARGTAVRDDSGAPVRMAGSITDVGTLKQAEHDLHFANTELQAILDAANFTIISTDPDGLIETFNLGAERMLGYTADEMVGKATPALIHDPDEVVQRAMQFGEELGTTIEPGFEVFVAKARLGIPDENEWSYIRKDGSRFPVLLSVTSLQDANGKIVGFLGVGRDISDWKKIDRIKSEFVSVVSHELRTPLSALQAALGLIHGGVAGTVPEKIGELLEIANRNSDRLLVLINDILDIERIQAGQLQFKFELVDAGEIVTRMVKTNQSLASEKDIQLCVETEQAIPRVEVDVARLEQVITNLISNAIKFSPANSKVRIDVCECDRFIRIRVTDEGGGIPEHFQERVFDRFVQVDSSDRREKLGAGLGLTITKNLVERMNGRISLDSSVGQGTSFYVDLPVVREAAENGREDTGSA